MSSYQCCGSEFIFLFGSKIFFCHFRIRILRLIFWHNNFLKSGSQCVHMYYSGTCKTEKKFCHRKNLQFVLFQVFNLRFFGIIFILKQDLDQYLDPNPNFFFIRIRPKPSDSVGFGSTTVIPQRKWVFGAQTREKLTK
jgi:hypothetical protein